MYTVSIPEVDILSEEILSTRIEKMWYGSVKRATQTKYLLIVESEAWGGFRCLGLIHTLSLLNIMSEYCLFSIINKNLSFIISIPFTVDTSKRVISKNFCIMFPN